MKRWLTYSIVFLVVIAIPTALLIQVLTERPATKLDSTKQGEANTAPRHTIFGVLTNESAVITPAPTNLQTVNRLAGQVALRWSSTASERVNAYRVYRDGVFLGIVNETAFGDPDTVAGRTYTYSLVALSTSNVPSESTSLQVLVQSAVVVSPTPHVPTNTPGPTTGTNTNTASPATPTNTTPTNTNSSTNSNTTPYQPQVVDVHVTSDHVVGTDSILIYTGDSIRFILDQTGQELKIRFTPSPGTSSFTLDREHPTKTITFSSVGIFSFSAAEDDQDLAGVITVQQP